ncbi:hypothetical protein [Prauserella muralis]|uniref:Uncharacterized protein n=1 Tax=Prauserella muralis TaxID=588067 RepID=A0A2V4ARF4_9PSEU|nr:hypothetical protein [Prauserella muralis]PXY22614.1 hypothetical protein BAY60_22585 [Prauserella muralis]TWE28318.1 hypothetical protein FHX69_0972 [Prauserella muralis]
MDARHPELAVGDRVTYTAGRRSDWTRACRRGCVAATPVFDRYTTTWWVPVQPDGAAEDTEPKWVRRDRIVDVATPT